MNMTYHGQLVQRLPNVWLSSHGTPGQEDFVRYLELYTEEKQNVPSIEDQRGAGLIYVAAGVWFSGNITRKEVNLTTQTSVGNNSNTPTNDTMPPKKYVSWKKRFRMYRDHLTKIIKFADDNTPDYDPFTAPMDPIDGLGNQIFYAPPGGPVYLGDNFTRFENALRRRDEIIEMQDWLRDTQGDWRVPLIWSIPRVTLGQNLTWKDPLNTGLHVRKQVADTRANILLNLRCNAKLDRIRPYPYSRTCCTDYGVKPPTQLGLVAFGIIYLAVCIIFEILDLYNGRQEPQWRYFNMKAGSLVFALLMCYYADRTQMMAKGSKVWQLQDFIVLCMPFIAALLITIRRSRSHPLGELCLESKSMDEPCLSRSQTDEWKGWMQFLILIYNWTGADRGSVEVLIRLCVAAYLFQTGFGHTLYFIRKNDFSFNRVVSVLLRLNLLSCCLAYFMDTDYMFYYFSPLVSFWFLVVYTTMALGGKRYNSDPQVVVAKICISCLLVSAVFMATPFTEYAFGALKVVFNIQWDAKQWQSHVTLDMFIVYVGMIAAVIHNQMKTMPVYLGLRIIFAVSGLCATVYYFRTTSHLLMSEYRTWHPLTSFVPILAFIALRNVSGPVRNYHSTAMTWLGRCSLEIYILQFHILLTGDSGGILVIDGMFGDGSLMRDRWRTLAVILPIFLWVSHIVAQSTAHLVELFMHSSLEEQRLGMLTFAWAQKIPGGSKLTAAKVRIVGILLFMWFLNMISTGHEVRYALDGKHSIRIAPPPVKEMPY